MLDADGAIRDLSSLIDDVSGKHLGDESLAKLRSINPASLPRIDADVRIAPCVGAVGKFICIGLNYADHVAETGAKMPEEPVLFLKATSAINGPFDGIVKPPQATQMDWEVELALVIGKDTRYVDESAALDHIAGYCVANDVSERHFQKMLGGGQWAKGKGCDTFGPIGPWLVTRDEISDPCALSIWLKVNGEMRQNSSTAQMIFKPAMLVSYVSRFMSLQAGDIISTGTPPGVGMGMNPQTFLEVGDELEYGIDGLGVQRQRVIAWNKT